MTHLERIAALGLSVDQFSELTGYHPVTVRNWGRSRSGRGVQVVPQSVRLLLAAWEAEPTLLRAALELA